MLFLASLIGMALLLAVPANAGPVPSPGNKLGTIVVLNGRTIVADGQVAKAVVVFHGRTLIEGEVEGSVVVFDGATRISGDVRDNVIVFRGRVEVTEGAHIGGNLVSSGTTEVAKGARIEGERKHVSDVNFTGYSFLVRMLIWIAYTVSVLILGLLLLWLVPGRLESAAIAARSIGPSIGWGFAMLFGLPIAALLVTLTLVGIPLALSLLMALWFLFTVGYTVGMFAIGRRLVKRPAGRFGAFFAGFGSLRVAALVPVLGGLAWTATALLGLGSITVAVWRARRVMPDEARPDAPSLVPAAPASPPGAP